MSLISNYFLAFIVFIVCNYTINAQQDYQRIEKAETFSISGVIKDESGEVLPYTSIALYKSSDSSLMGGVASNDDGTFTISTLPGSYYLKISFLDYKSKIINNIIISTASFNAGIIILKKGILSLDEIVVESERSEMELKLEKRVFNVGKDLSNTGANAAEILDNVPSVAVDVDGNVSLRGSENVRILIDGKPSGLVSKADALRQLQGNIIERIEVITNPSARYDAEGEVGIINIVLKKERQKGLNGSFNLKAGYPSNYGGSFSLNYRTKNINYFANYGLNYRKNPGYGYSFQEFTTNDSSYSFERFRDHTRGGLSNNVRFGTEFFLKNNHTITTSFLYNYSDGNNTAFIEYNDYNEENVLQQVVTRDEEEQEIQRNYEYSLDYLKTFKKKGQELSASVKWIQSDDRENSVILQQSTEENTGDFRQFVNNTEDEKNWLAQVDYVHPFRTEGKFEAGLKATIRDIYNDFQVQEEDSSGTIYILPGLNSQLSYNEGIYAGYLMFGNKVEAFSNQLGLRAEHSDITTLLVLTGEENKRQYLNLFPSAHFSYQLKKDNDLQLSYSRRLSRPHFRQLLPFSSYSDPRNFYVGNPNLNPEYTHSLELGYLSTWGKGSLLSSIYYRHRTGVIERINISDTANTILIIPVNLSKQNAYGLEFNFSYNLKEWWRLNANFNFYRAITNGNYEGRNLFADTYTWSTRGFSKWSINKKTDIQLSFNYRAPQQTTQGSTKSIYSTDLGISREVLETKGTLTLSVRDIFNTRIRRSVTETDNFTSISEFQWRSRQIVLSFSYYLNQKKKRSDRDSDGFEGDEF